MKRKSGPWCYELVELVLRSIEHVWGLCLKCYLLYLSSFLPVVLTVNQQNATSNFVKHELCFFSLSLSLFLSVSLSRVYQGICPCMEGKR